MCFEFDVAGYAEMLGPESSWDGPLAAGMCEETELTQLWWLLVTSFYVTLENNSNTGNLRDYTVW